MASQDTVFTNAAGAAAAGTAAYLQDSFIDTSLPASSNAGYSSTISNNPFGLSLGNDDSTRFGPKTLYIKDLVLISDRTKWVNNEPTYTIIFNESFPQVSAYAFGNINVIRPVNGQTYLQFNSVGDGVGIGGIIQRIQWIVTGDPNATATAQLKLDGANTNTIDFSTVSVDPQKGGIMAREIPYLAETVSETKNIHDFRIVANQANVFKVTGVVVYFENSGANVDQFPGSTYVNKSKVTTTQGATFALPSFGSSLGGTALVYKTSATSYALSALSASTITSIGQGLSGTNLVNVSTGTGASFNVSQGIIATIGATSYIGYVVSISTDTLTVSPTLPFGFSNSVYRSFNSGSTYSINATLQPFYTSISMQDYSGVSQSIIDPQGRFALWGGNIGLTTINGLESVAFLGSSGFLQVDGYFSALDFETVGTTTTVQYFNATIMVNGFPTYSLANAYGGATTSLVKYTAMSDAGPGWNSVAILPGASMGVMGINRINLYRRAKDPGVTFGMLGQIDGIQGFANRAISATTLCPGTAQRVYGDQMYFKGPWVRSQGATGAGGYHYTASSSSCSLRQEYYGKHVGVIGTPGTGTLAIDGSGVGLTFNVMNIGTTEGFHNITYSHVSGTCIIDAIDISRSFGEMKDLRNFFPLATVGASVAIQRNEVILANGNGRGSSAGALRRFATIVSQYGTAITYTDSVTAGMACVINQPGYYDITYSDSGQTSAEMGISKNALANNFQAISIGSLPPTLLLAITSYGNTLTGQASASPYLNAGDVICAHDDQSNTGASGRVHFSITKVSP